MGAICPSPRARSGTAPLRIDKAPGIWLLTHLAAPREQCSVCAISMLAAKRNSSLTHWNACIDKGLIEPSGEALDALRGRIERGNHRRLRRLRPVGGDNARLLELGEFGLEPLQLLLDLREFIGKCECRHDREPHVTNFAETRAQLNDAPIEIFREVRDTRLFAVLTCHPKLAAVDGNADLRHGTLRAGSPRARIGSCRWRHRAAERLHDSRFPACGCARSRHQAPPQAASGRRQARAVARQESARRDRPRAAARQRRRAHRAQAQDACWRRRWRSLRSSSMAPCSADYSADSSAVWREKSFASASSYKEKPTLRVGSQSTFDANSPSPL